MTTRTGIFPSFNIYAGKTFSEEKELGRDIAVDLVYVLDSRGSF